MNWNRPVSETSRSQKFYCPFCNLAVYYPQNHRNYKKEQKPAVCPYIYCPWCGEQIRRDESTEIEKTTKTEPMLYISHDGHKDAIPLREIQSVCVSKGREGKLTLIVVVTGDEFQSRYERELCSFKTVTFNQIGRIADGIWRHIQENDSLTLSF